jgi:hypothetical protein
MIFFILLFGCGMVGAGVYVAADNRRARNEKLAKIQRELARREAAEIVKETANPQD